MVWGPPGTGKSQTIANLIAALIADSKRVLFVAQKQAAVEVVISRLNRAGLGDLVMDCHGGFKSRREFSRGLAEAIQRIGSTPMGEYVDLHRQLSQSKQVLVEHAGALHRRREPWDVSAFQVQTELMEIPEGARTGLRLPREKVNQLSRDELRELQRDVQQWIDLEGPWLAKRYPNWAGAAPSSPNEVRVLLELVRSLLQELLPRCHSELSACAGQVSMRAPEAVADWPSLTGLLAEIEQDRQKFSAGIYRLDRGQLMAALAPRSGLGRLTAGLSGSYRSARRAVQEYVLTGERLSGDEAYHALARSNDQVRRWLEFCADGEKSPQAPEGAAGLHLQVTELTSALASLSNGIGRPELLCMSFEELRFVLETMASQEAVATRLPQLRELEGRFNDAGIGQIVSTLGSNIPVRLASQAVAHAWLQGVWSELTLDEPRLGGFVGESHNRSRDDFARLDAQHLRRNPERIRRLAAERAVAAMNEFPGADRPGETRGGEEE